MIELDLDGIFQGIESPDKESTSLPFFVVKSVPCHDGYFLGKDTAGHACLLVKTQTAIGRKPSPIRLENIEAQFDVACHVTYSDEPIREDQFTVICCRSDEPGTTRYFLSFCKIIIRHLGKWPTCRAIANAIQRIASIFQYIKRAPIRSLNGLFGELFIITQSRSPERALSAWRTDENSRFDFILGGSRMDVKCCAGRVRSHTFTFDQCNPPHQSLALVASIMIERIADGISIGDLTATIESRVSGNFELILKLHQVVASTLGSDISESYKIKFDRQLAESSLQFFDLREIPAIRGDIHPRISEVNFSVNLSGLSPIDLEIIAICDSNFYELMPSR